MPSLLALVAVAVPPEITVVTLIKVLVIVIALILSLLLFGRFFF